MASKGGKRQCHRYAAPKAMKIERKTHTWITKPAPGPHPTEVSIPLRTLISEKLHLGKTARETDRIINGGNVLVDGVARREPKFPVGLMDVVQIPAAGCSYRMLIDRSGALTLVRIDQSESSFKLCKVTGKRTISGNRTQLSLHDGRTIIGNAEAKPNDVLKIGLPDQKIIETLPFKVGATSLVIGGSNVGMTGTISEVKITPGGHPNLITLKTKSGEIQVPENYVFIIGKDTTCIKVNGDEE
ncbi:MAG: 30S ribosomal protein S4e [Candidatus Hadarchaeales archaeon]